MANTNMNVLSVHFVSGEEDSVLAIYHLRRAWDMTLLSVMFFVLASWCWVCLISGLFLVSHDSFLCKPIPETEPIPRKSVVYTPTYVTHEFVVFPELKPKEKTANEWVAKVYIPHFSTVLLYAFPLSETSLLLSLFLRCSLSLFCE